MTVHNLKSAATPRAGERGCNPKGCEKVAGGRSVSVDHRIGELKIIGTLKGCESLCLKSQKSHLARVSTARGSGWVDDQGAILY